MVSKIRPTIAKCTSISLLLLLLPVLLWLIIATVHLHCYCYYCYHIYYHLLLLYLYIIIEVVISNLLKEFFDESACPSFVQVPVLGWMADISTVNYQRQRLCLIDANNVKPKEKIIQAELG